MQYKLVLTLFFSFLYSITVKSQQVSIIVASDTHVMHESLYDVPYGDAFIRAMQQDLKVSESSQQLFDKFVGTVINEKPNLLLITGDLTKDGEKASHEYIATRLRDIESAGTKVYIIPGNHDMENPLAYSYRRGKTEKTPSVSEQEFWQIYKDFGPGEAVSTDSLSGSYIAYPTPELAIVAINSNIPNRYKSRYVHGRLWQSTLNWIEEVSTEARLAGRTVIAMCHHQVMPHHNQEDNFAPTAMLNMERGVKKLPTQRDVQETLTRSGIRVVLTGHYHTQSVTDVQTLHGKLTDISTGALAGYPSPWRRMTYSHDSKKLRVTSASLHGGRPPHWASNDISNRQADRLRYMVQLYVPKLSGIKTDLNDAYQYLATPYNKALCALAAGDETNLKPKAIYDECMDATDKYIKHALMYNIVKINSLRAQKNNPWTRASDLFGSIMYNYVGTKKHVTPDNSITLTLK